MTLSGSIPAAPWHCADTQQILACHCEERSDVAIRNSCGSTWQRVVPKANPQPVRIRPSSCQLVRYPCGDADCRTSAIQAAHPSPRLFRRKSQVSVAPLHRLLRAAQVRPGSILHWFAMTCRRRAGVCGCKGLPPLSLRGAERRGNPPPQGKTDRRNHCCAGPWKRNLVFAFTAG